MWCPPTDEALELIASFGLPVVEIGAGDGEWLTRLPGAIGYDLRPKHPEVRLGDHLAAAEHTGRAMLAVWPPDGPVVVEWIEAAPWPMVFLCANFGRLSLGEALERYEEVGRVELPANPVRDKGSSELRAYALSPM